MAEQSPAERAVEILRRELPGFESKIDADRDLVIVRGAIHFAASLTLDAIYAVPSAPEFGDGPSRSIDYEPAEQFAAHLVEQTRRHVIQLVGLDALIADAVQAGRNEGHRDGYAQGKVAGIAEGRREMLAEVIAATDDGVYEGPRHV